MSTSAVAQRSLIRALGMAGSRLSRPCPAPHRRGAAPAPASSPALRALAGGPGEPRSALTAGTSPALVYVASKNAVKVDAVRDALRLLLPGAAGGFEVRGVAADSGVPDQPFGDAETQRGARLRCRSVAQEVAAAAAFPVGAPPRAPALIVAVEGGVGWQDRVAPDGSPVPKPAALSDPAAPAGGWSLECFAWAVARDPRGRESAARSASFVLPQEVARLVAEEGLELGDADDRVFRRVRSGQGSGTIGRLTGGRVTRTAFYEHAVAMALVPLLSPELYPAFDLGGEGGG